MPERFRVRLAQPADADMVAWHRARMFQEMGDVPPHLFETFRTQSRERLHQLLARGEYVGWLASSENAPENIIGGAGVHLQRVLPHPLTRANGEAIIAQGRHAIIVNVFTEPDWRRRGVAAFLMERIIEWAREEKIDRLVLHASDQARVLYERFGFVATNEMRFAGDLSASPVIEHF
jgi:GNAT superfamily N-acetyltransferase